MRRFMQECVRGPVTVNWTYLPPGNSIREFRPRFIPCDSSAVDTQQVFRRECRFENGFNTLKFPLSRLTTHGGHSPRYHI